MKLNRTDNGEETNITVEGSLDTVTAPEFRQMAEKVAADGRKVITLDMSALHHIDSSGVGAIVSLFKRVRAYEGEVRVVGLRDQPRAIFRLLRLDRVFPC